MRNLLNPKWIFVINTLPVIILATLSYSEYNVIKSLLSKRSIAMWSYFGIALAILAVINFAYAIYLIIRKKNLDWIFSLAALVGYTIFSVTYYMNFESIVPFSIPMWMTSGSLFRNPGTFLMPSLMYYLFVLVIYSVRENKNAKPWISFASAVVVPILFYVMFVVLLPLLSFECFDVVRHAITIFIVTGVTAFLFFLIRGVYIFSTSKGKLFKEHQLVWRLVISIIFPLAGLVLNMKLFGGGAENVFGNFSSPWFFIIAVINGIFICLPMLKKMEYRLALFTCRCLTFSYTLYFFIVFLPYLPLSVFAVIVAGLGFLVLTPLALFIIHINVLAEDFAFLKSRFSKTLLVAIMFLGTAAIPVIVHFNFLKDRTALNQVLGYICTPNYAKKYDINKSSLASVLEKVKSHKDTDSSGPFRRSDNNNQIPYLSSYYTWLVLDNLTLSDKKINEIERVFFGKKHEKIEPLRRLNKNVNISKIVTESKYDAAKGYWTSWVHLNILNRNRVFTLAEYVTILDLPEGCWISDYYLYVEGKKEMGILAEKRAAMWIYSKIRRVRRDPGILYYLNGNKVAFRVFPFIKEQVRKTGIQFIHKQPVTLKFDDRVVKLGNTKETAKASVAKSVDGNVIFVPAELKQQLPQIHRTPYFHFIVDASARAEKCKQEFVSRVENLMKKNLIDGKDFRISFVNSYVNTVSESSTKNWKQQFASSKNDGGFSLERALKTILFKSYKSRSDSYPVLVVVTNNLKEAVLEKGLADFRMTFPESDYFYVLNDVGKLKRHSLVSDPKKELGVFSKDVLRRRVYGYPDADSPIAFLRIDNQAGIVLKKDIFDVSSCKIEGKDWNSGLIMQGEWLSQVLHPETSDNEWLKLVKHSFASQIMSPLTSYIVVENEAQKAALKRKQEQILSAKNSLDAGDEVQKMSEPGMLLMLLMFGGLVIIVLRKRIKLKQ